MIPPDPRASELSVPVTLVKDDSCLSVFKDSSHTCPLRMAVRVRPLACLKYSESCRVVGVLELREDFNLQWRAMGDHVEEVDGALKEHRDGVCTGRSSRGVGST